ncbi:hypothetical protein BDU57DRAFT_574590 [Ampelomyces quisqualis]|uniref:Ankyrin repeat-containing domain protein n=1 Tax=Ampelomyces quisqualis TaxID=50730 RepID=A0A6A5QLR3_AMPQU|nr:hypothetical protein BDU57DRAFT_574590 [Ampelomyces quisqualis]
MSILDIPNEIFDEIVRYAIEENGVNGIIPLRSGCRSLRDKVDDLIFIETSITELKTSKYIGYIKNNVEGYLFGQVLKPAGPDVQPELPAIVHKMTDYLCSALELTSLEDRMSCQKRLCVEFCHYYGRGRILRLLWSESAVALANLPNNDSSNLPNAYKRLAAILLRAYHLRDDLQTGSLLRIPTFNNNCATLLAYAVRTENTVLLDLIIEHCRDTIKVSLGLKDALELALKRSRVDFACKILSVMKTSDLIQKHIYIRLLDLAIPLANPECVKKITELCPAGLVLLQKHYTSVLKSSSLEMVTALFEIGKIGVNDALLDGLPIETACRAGNMEVIRGLLNAGARVPDAVLSRALKHDKWDVLYCLWRHGYPLPTMDKWPRNCSQSSYDHLCMMKIAEGAERQPLPSHTEFKWMGWQALRNL